MRPLLPLTECNSIYSSQHGKFLSPNVLRVTSAHLGPISVSGTNKHQETCKDHPDNEAQEDVEDSETTGIMLDDAAWEDEGHEEAEKPILQGESHKRPGVSLS